MSEIVNVGASSNVHLDPAIADASLQDLIKSMLVDKIEDVEQEAREEVKVLTERQKRIEYLNKYLRGINSETSSKDGTVDTGKLEHLKEEGLKFKEEADSFREKADELREKLQELKDGNENYSKEIRAIEKEINWLEESAEEIDSMLQACDIIDNEGNIVDGPRKYSDAVRGKVIENIRSHSKILQSRNSYQSQMVTRLNNERHEVLMLAKEMARNLHEIIKRMASNTRG